MNKKHLVALGILAVTSVTTYAQKSKIREANKAYDKAFIALAAQNWAEAEKNLVEADAAADAAITNPETANNASAWLAKAAANVSMMQIEKFQPQQPYKKGIDAFKKAISLDPKIDKTDGVGTMLLNAGYFAFNDGIADYNAGTYPKAIEEFALLNETLGYKDGSFFKDNKQVDTIKAQANMYDGFASYYSKDYDAALVKLNNAAKNPITANSADVYRMIALAYGDKGDKAKQMEALQTAKQKFPENKDIATDELNYYVSEGKQEVLISKFEEAFAKDPSNAQYANNLGILYTNLAFGKDGNAPENSEEMLTKAENYYKKALEIDGNNPLYLSSYGELYTRKADAIGGKMNDLTTSKADQAKYDGMLKLRTSYLSQALSNLEKASALYEDKQTKGTLKGPELQSYINGLQVLSMIYATQNNAEKSSEYKAKLEKFK